LVHGDDVLPLNFDCRPCEMHVFGKIKNHLFILPQPGSVVASVIPEALMKTLPKRRGVLFKKISLWFEGFGAGV
ncbi:hypothetical protein, partial [Salmonella enterica]|uniref:hypothetical protein n=1 Tax=Salmonella enterica TaxID=28901 RepID=UPI003299B62B